MRVLPSAAVLLAIGLVSTGCGSSGGTAERADAAAAPSTTTSSTTAPDTCGAGGVVTDEVQERTVASGGQERSFLLDLPGSYEEGTPADVVFDFHGAGSNSTEQYLYGDFREEAEQDGVILVAPESRRLEAGHRSIKAWAGRIRGDDSDIQYVLDIVEVLEAEYCIGDLHAAGMSSGGDMTSTLACVEDSPFSAYATVTLVTFEPETCAKAPARPLVHFHGTDDEVVTMDGTSVALLDRSVPETVALWADHNGCDAEPLEEAVTDEVTRFEWDGCEAPTSWYRVDGGGHTWPGAIEVPALGPVTRDIDASAIIWDHFFGP